MSYSPYVRPVTLDGVKCVAVDKALKDVEPQGFRFLMGFAEDNDLQMAENVDATAAAREAVAIAN